MIRKPVRPPMDIGVASDSGSDVVLYTTQGSVAVQCKVDVLRNLDVVVLGSVGVGVVSRKDALAYFGAGKAALRAPPVSAEWMLRLLLSASKRDAILGDLDERFQKDIRRYGEPCARWFYWAEAIRSVWPLIRRGAGRAFRWGALAELAHRVFGGG